MPQRLIQIVLPKSEKPDVDHLLSDLDGATRWTVDLPDDKTLTTILIKTTEAETLMDEFERRYNYNRDFRLVLLPVEASLPRKDEEESKAPSKKTKAKRARVSREELYNDISMSAGITPMFVAMVVLSTIVASIGLVKDNTAAIIGAMVIAPLLGPNAALALALALGDSKLALRAVKANALGLAVAFGMSFVAGLAVPIDVDIREIASRTAVAPGDVAVAVAAGVAGTLAFTSGAPASLIGVMVAVALLPPTVVFGMLIGSGQWGSALGALLLLSVNVTAVNLSGVTTFVLQGIRPRAWWEAKKARTTARAAIAVWLVVLAVLTFLIYLAS